MTRKDQKVIGIKSSTYIELDSLRKIGQSNDGIIQELIKTDKEYKQLKEPY
jgi:hypothetical protein